MLDRFLDFLCIRIRTTIQNVVENGVVEQHRILRHDADGFAQRLNLQILNVDAANLDASATAVIETKQQFDERGFAGTTRTNHCHLFTGRNPEADVFKNFAFRVVLKTDSVEDYFGQARVQRKRAFFLADARLLF